MRMDMQGNAVEEKGSGNAEFQVPDSPISFSLLWIFIFIKATHSLNSQSQIVLQATPLASPGAMLPPELRSSEAYIIFLDLKI